MILPVPSWVLDIGLAASFSLAILMFTITLFIERPLDFSAFPMILLGSLILRLSLNIASTKLIIGEGHTGTGAAGNVIEGFSTFIMGGNVALGLVVFCVLLIVNFLVINKGATRMSEVGARFALDAMPGKQLAIDSDLASGAITHDQAKERREREQSETTFFGSLDGASKFVKGDAIAGLLITILNLCVGLAIGVFGHGMTIGDGFKTYSILTVGDGLVSQIPAVLVSIASALLLARGGATGSIDTTVTDQLSKHPAALISVAVLIALFGLVPGLPIVPFVLLAIILALSAHWANMKAVDTQKPEVSKPIIQEVDAHQPALSSLLDTEEIHIEFATNLIPIALDPETGLDMRITNIRKHIALEFGILLPEIHLTDNYQLEDGEYVIKIMDVAHGRFILKPQLSLVLNTESQTLPTKGMLVKEPVFNASAIWVDESAAEEATLNGFTVVQPCEVLATHLFEILKQNFSKLFTLSTLQSRLSEMTTLPNSARADANRVFLNSLVPEKVSQELLHSTLRTLLTEQISIRNINLIIEAIAEGRQFTQNWDDIYEHVRSRLGFQIIDRLKDSNGKLHIIQMAHEWEELFKTYTVKNSVQIRDEVTLPPSLLQNLLNSVDHEISNASHSKKNIVIITIGKRRRYLKTILVAKGITTPVISYDEIGEGTELNLIGTINT